MSDFITDVEHQYEVYCKIAEEHGFIDLNAKRNSFRCTTKSNEFNAGWIAFVGAVAAVRDEQQAKINEMQKRINELERGLKEVGYDSGCECCMLNQVDVREALRGEHE